MDVRERVCVCVCVQIWVSTVCMYPAGWSEHNSNLPGDSNPLLPHPTCFRAELMRNEGKTQIDLIRRKKRFLLSFFVGTMVQQQRSFVPNGFGDFEMSYSHPTNVIYFGQHTIINCRIEKNEFY